VEFAGNRNLGGKDLHAGVPGMPNIKFRRHMVVTLLSGGQVSGEPVLSWELGKKTA